ncbi:MAG: V-type ATPase 116kDa subunit family protein, partial [Pseudomonadota bacterium]
YQQLGPIWQECSRCEESMRQVLEQQQLLRQQERALSRLENLDVELDTLRGDRRFLDLRVGSLESDQLSRVQGAVNLIGYSVYPVYRDDQSVHLILVGLKGQEHQLQAVLRAAGFHALEIPAEFAGHPREVREDLVRRARDAGDREQEARRCLADLRAAHAPFVRAAHRALRTAGPYAALAEAVRSHGGLAQLNGWVPASDLGRLHRRLDETLEAHHLEARPPRPDEFDEVPSVRRYPRFLMPFATLVRAYGTPRYDEFDPTWLFALTFVFMYGMMFGDLGHGAVIAMAAWLARRWLKGFLWFGLAAGLSSMFFGVLYGSVFGFEDWITPLWLSPLHDPMRLLTVAIAWGVGFIVLATLLSALNLWRSGQRQRALLDVHGLAGLALYVTLGLALYATQTERGFTAWHAVGLVLALGAVLTGIWRESEARGGERVLVTLVEGFEAVMGYVSNTLSFLRVAAFSLNHAALAIAVITVAAMLDTAGHAIALLLGNLIILVLEGGIVLIQVLRLEYYEGFARYYRGDGRPYRPLTLETTGAMRAGPQAR